MALLVGNDLAALLTAAAPEAGARRGAAAAVPPQGFADLLAMASQNSAPAPPMLPQAVATTKPTSPGPQLPEPGTAPRASPAAVAAVWPWDALAAAAEEADLLAGSFQHSAASPRAAAQSSFFAEDKASQAIPEAAVAVPEPPLPLPAPLPAVMPPIASPSVAAVLPQAVASPASPFSAPVEPSTSPGSEAMTTAVLPVPMRERAVPEPVSTSEPAGPAAGPALATDTADASQFDHSRARPGTITQIAAFEIHKGAAIDATASRPAAESLQAPVPEEPDSLLAPTIPDALRAAPALTDRSAPDTTEPRHPASRIGAAPAIPAAAPQAIELPEAGAAESPNVPAGSVPAMPCGDGAPLPLSRSASEQPDRPALLSPAPATDHAVVAGPALPETKAEASRQPAPTALHAAPRPHLPPETSHQIALRVATAAAAGVESVSVDLRPPELGRLELRLTFQDGTVQVSLAAERSDTFEALRQDRSQLEQQMQQAGLQLGGGGLDLQHGHLPREAPEQAQTLSPGAEHNDLPEEDTNAGPRPRSDSLIDLIA
jgi:flagellar hook-length control protein FliK